MEQLTGLNPSESKSPQDPSLRAPSCTATAKAEETTQLHSLRPAYLTRSVKGHLPCVIFPTPLSRVVSNLSNL